MKLNLLQVLAAAAPAIALPSELSARQSPSTSWTYTCSSLAAPGDFKAFNLNSCTAQLTFNKDRYIGVQWAFEATYADGSKVVQTPLSSTNFGVSDTFYPFPGNNFLTAFPGQSAYTAVFEFTNVCKGRAAPVSWRFYTTSANSACSSASYRYTTGQIAAKNEARPAKVTGITLTRVNDEGDFKVYWNGIADARTYSVIVEYPSGEDELGNPYFNTRGARVRQGNYPTIPTTSRRKDVPRKVIVHTYTNNGVWSYANDVQPVIASW